MDRRMVAGLVGLALVGSARPSAAQQQMKNASQAGTVGYTPLDPIAGQIGRDAVPLGAEPAPPGVPTDPTKTGPAARVPSPPVGPNPVGLTEQPNLGEAVEQGYPTSGFGWFFRRNPRAKATPAPPTRAARSVPAAKVDPGAVPAGLTWDEAGPVPLSAAGLSGASGVRPAPYADRQPDLPRRQALGPAPGVADDVAAPGRAAPLRADTPRQARPRLTRDDAAVPKPRGQGSAAANPRTPPPVAPAPPLPTTLPPLAPPESLPPLAAVALDPLPEPAEPPPALPAEPFPMPAIAPVASAVAAPAEAVPLDLPSVEPIRPAPVVEPAILADSARSAGLVDPALVRTSGDPTALRTAPRVEPSREFAVACAAVVGDEVITFEQVKTMVRERYKIMTAGQQVSKEDEHEMLNVLGVMAVERLVEQNLVLQEAHRQMRKAPKLKQQVTEAADKRWLEDKLPGLLRKYSASNVFELRERLKKAGLSYAEMKDAFRDEMLEQQFLFKEIRNKLNADLKDLRAYYNENIDRYNQPARLSWREVEVGVANHPDRAAARRQAEALRARIARGEDFAAVAQGGSDGPTASQGGLYADMTPGGYGIAPVNAVLGSIPIGQVSPVIEAPRSFHIVRVESRREAGPLHFEEVQKQVGDAVFERNFAKARAEYIAKLRSMTVVRIMPMFDREQIEREHTARLQAQAQADPRARPAANR